MCNIKAQAKVYNIMLWTIDQCHMIFLPHDVEIHHLVGYVPNSFTRLYEILSVGVLLATSITPTPTRVSDTTRIGHADAPYSPKCRYGDTEI